jgi:hypothetical protein
MQGTTINNRCPNCGAPLRAGQTALDCDYCGQQQKQTQPAPATPAKNSLNPAYATPPKTNVLWYVAIWMIGGGLGAAIGKPQSTIDEALMFITGLFFCVSLLSLLWYGVRWLSWRANRRR